MVVGWIPEKVPHARNLRSGEPFWVTLDRQGLVCEAIEAPLAFPADHMEHGSCLAGLGVPDAQAEIVVAVKSSTLHASPFTN